MNWEVKPRKSKVEKCSTCIFQSGAPKPDIDGNVEIYCIWDNKWHDIMDTCEAWSIDSAGRNAAKDYKFSRMESIRSYYEKRPVPLIFLILIIIGSPFIGLFFAGFWGIIVGLLAGLISFCVGLKAVSKVVEKS